jgi:hypothetical protein
MRNTVLSTVNVSHSFPLSGNVPDYFDRDDEGTAKTALGLKSNFSDLLPEVNCPGI